MKPINSISSSSPVAAVQAVPSLRNDSKPTFDMAQEQQEAASQVTSTSSNDFGTTEKAIKELQKVINAIQGPQKLLEVSIHKETHAVMIKVKNKDTGELIREVPSEKILDAIAKLMEVTGLIVDKRI